MLPGETFDSIYSLSPPDCSLKYFRQTYSVHCIRIYMYATNINEEFLFVNHKNHLYEQNNVVVEYILLLPPDTYSFPKICAPPRCFLVFDFRFLFFRYKISASILFLSLFFEAVKCNFYTLSTIYNDAAYKSTVSAALKTPRSTLHFILFPHEITISY